MLASQLPASKQADFTEPPRSDNSRKLKDLKDDIRRSQRNVRDGFLTPAELATQVYNDLSQAILEDFPVEERSNDKVCLVLSVDSLSLSLSLSNNVSLTYCYDRPIWCTKATQLPALASVRSIYYYYSLFAISHYLQQDVKNQNLSSQLRNFIYSETENITLVSGTFHWITLLSLSEHFFFIGRAGLGKSALLANFWVDLLLEQERLGSLGDRTLIIAHFTSAGEETTSCRCCLVGFLCGSRSNSLTPMTTQ